MLIYKILFCAALFCRLTWALSIENLSDDFGKVELEHSKPLSSEEALTTPKAHWQPICQQVQVNDVEANLVQPESQVVYVPQEVPGIVISPGRTANNDDVCASPDGRGLKNLLKAAAALLPKDRIKHIAVCASKDLEVQQLITLLKSNSFRAKVDAVINSSHYIVLRDYMCSVLNLDVKHYYGFVRTVLGLEKLKETIELPADCKGRDGILGMLQDLREAIPAQELHDLYKRLLANDAYLVRAVERLKSTEFLQLLINLENTKEVNELKYQLRDAGLPLEYVKDLIDIALGWLDDEIRMLL